MSNTPSEEAGKVATHVVHAFVGNPHFLLILVLNVIILGAFIYVAKTQAEERALIAANGYEIDKLMLANCDGKTP